MLRCLPHIALVAVALFLPSVGVLAAQEMAAVDLYDDALPPGAVGRLGSIRFHHPGGIATMAFSPDGKVIIGAGPGKKGETILVWDAATGKELIRFGPEERYDFQTLTFLRDGKTIAVGHQQVVKLYDWRTGKLLRSLGAYYATFDFSPDGTLLAAASQKETKNTKLERSFHLIRIWEVATGRELPPLEMGTNMVQSLRFSADGTSVMNRTIPVPDPRSARSMISNEPGFVSVWELATRKRLHVCKCPTENVVFAPDGVTIAFQHQHRQGFSEISVVNVPSGKTLCKINSEPASLGFTRDGKALVAVTQKEAALWDPATGKQIRRMGGHLAENPRLGGFSADGKLMAVTSGGWYQDGLVRLWKVASGEAIRGNAGHQDEITRVAYAPDGKLIASASRDRTVRLWDPVTFREVRRLDGHETDVLAVAFSPDGKSLASISADGATRLWDVADGRQLAQLDGPKGDAARLAFAADGKTLLAAGQAGKTLVWDLTEVKNARYHEFTGKNPIILALTPDGNSFLASEHLRDEDPDPDQLRLVSLLTFKPIRVMPLNMCRHPNTRSLCVGAAVSADGKRIASWQSVVSSNSPLPKDQGPALQVWEHATGQEIFKAMFTYFDTLSFSRDGRLIAGSHSTSNTDWRMCRGGLTFYDAWTGQKVGSLPGHTGLIGALAFSPDGRTLASGSADHTILLWKHDMKPAVQPAKAGPTAKQLDAWWQELGDSNTAGAYRALAELASHPDLAVRLIEERLKPAPPVDGAKIARLIKDLDSPNFATRQLASAAIEKLETAELALRQALSSKPPLEARRRLELVLAKVEQAPPTPARLRSHRAIIALQSIDSPAARRTLEILADGANEARQTQEALASLKHLGAGVKRNK